MSTTFSDSNYSAQSYLQHRPRYPQGLYQTILEFHKTPTEHSGQPCPASHTKLALDIGCGPGIATAELVPRFEKVIAIDDSESMIKIASSQHPQAEFHVASAANMPMVESGTVDLITAATAVPRSNVVTAHWFPPHWWEEAYRVVKPGGTVALWTYSERMIIGKSLTKKEISSDDLEPTHSKTHELNELQATLIEAISHNFTPRLQFVSSMYDTLPLPHSGLKFGPIKRIFWNRGSVDDLDMLMGQTMNVGSLRQRLHTFSPVHCWRTGKAPIFRVQKNSKTIQNPLKKDTQEDPVEQMLTRLKAITGWNDATEFTTGSPLALLMTKRLA
ncbi:uncharacterized protein VP01_3502g4 [Puccinia sorghi]|uniref:Methyltransferase type 11 domain-containing protein n=1 Tax=Puccinia sorghi TaxID=27349 RepID=A0A0L6UVM7_9BASI|nr:uncharacterized protein VP01_3502g4 [Puccinia sorghi]